MQIVIAGVSGCLGYSLAEQGRHQGPADHMGCIC
jgi:hypothetical protein